MKVCAHTAVAPFQHVHERFDTIKDAVHSLREWDESTFGPASDPERFPCMDLYPQCGDCNSEMNFHDYPMARYEVGPRGGIRKVVI